MAVHVRVPDIDIPAGATDCHMHIFGPPDRYPPSPARTYTPVPAYLPEYRAVADALGLERTVVVQPSAYGSDNSCTLDAVAEIGPSARAVVGIDASTSDDELKAMHARGARGVRLNAASRGLDDIGEIGALADAIAGRIAPLGWHLQIFTNLSVIKGLAPRLGSMPVPVVFDHMALARAESGPDQAGFDTLCDLLAGGRCWVKVSGAYRISSREPAFADAAPIIRALIQANPRRAVWGTDWPHTGGHGHKQDAEAPPIELRRIDTAGLLEQVADCAGDRQTLTRVLVGNPAELYDF